MMIDSGLFGSGRGTTRAEDAQGTPTQSHISPSIQVYKDDLVERGGLWRVEREGGSGEVPQGEKMLYSGKDSGSLITEYT